jgi:hypothetical protein
MGVWLDGAAGTDGFVAVESLFLDEARDFMAENLRRPPRERHGVFTPYAIQARKSQMREGASEIKPRFPHTRNLVTAWSIV